MVVRHQKGRVRRIVPRVATGTGHQRFGYQQSCIHRRRWQVRGNTQSPFPLRHSQSISFGKNRQPVCDFEGQTCRSCNTSASGAKANTHCNFAKQARSIGGAPQQANGNVRCIKQCTYQSNRCRSGGSRNFQFESNNRAKRLDWSTHQGQDQLYLVYRHKLPQGLYRRTSHNLPQGWFGSSNGGWRKGRLRQLARRPQDLHLCCNHFGCTKHRCN